MSDIDIASLDVGELEVLLHSALNPAVPVEVLYATLDRLSTTASWRSGLSVPHEALGAADMTSVWSINRDTFRHAPPAASEVNAVEQVNAVLRGGPFDGYVIEADPRMEVIRTVRSVVHIYRPTSQIDREYPGLQVFVLDRTEQLGRS